RLGRGRAGRSEPGRSATRRVRAGWRRGRGRRHDVILVATSACAVLANILVSTKSKHAPPREGSTMEEALTETATLLATVAATVRPDQLDAPTPCSEFSVAELLDHVGEELQDSEQAARKVPRTKEY